MLAPHYNLWIWTASTKDIMLPIIQKYVDPKGLLIKKILYREMCIKFNGAYYLKDPRIFDGCDISKYAIIDN